MGLDIKKGDVVSLDRDGKLRKGAGTTIYHNVQQIHNKTLYHLHTVVIGDTIHVAQYDSEMLVTVIDPDTDAILATQTVRSRSLDSLSLIVRSPCHSRQRTPS